MRPTRSVSRRSSEPLRRDPPADLVSSGAGVGDAAGRVGLQVGQRVRRRDPGPPEPVRGLSRLRPETATTGTPAGRVAWETPIGALPASDCSSSEPSPVMTRSAPRHGRGEADQVQHQLDAGPQRRAEQGDRREAGAPGRTRPRASRSGRCRWPRATDRRPTAAAPARAPPRRAGSRPSAARRPRPPRGAEQRVVDVAGHGTCDARAAAPQLAQVDGGRRRPARRRRGRPRGRRRRVTRAPSAWTIPAPPSVEALPPSPSTTSVAPAADRVADHLTRARTSRRPAGRAGRSGSRSRPTTSASSTTARRPSIAYEASTGSPVGPTTVTVRPVKPAETAAATVPSPPSATGAAGRRRPGPDRSWSARRPRPRRPPPRSASP